MTFFAAKNVSVMVAYSAVPITGYHAHSDSVSRWLVNVCVFF